MVNSAHSINDIPIRLTDERWIHIVENHDDLAGYYYDILDIVSNPTHVLEGDSDDVWAVRFISARKALVVIYKELKESNDGFIITAFSTTQIRKLLTRKIIWHSLHQ